MNDAWSIAYDNFDTDDGSLPGILFSNLRPRSVQFIHDYFRINGTVETENPTIYIEKLAADVPLEDIADPAQVVIDGGSHSFHCCFKGVTNAAQEFPTLGLFIFADSVEIDYRMGPAWNRDNVNALFSFLAYLQSFCTGCTVGSAAMAVRQAAHVRDSALPIGGDR